MEGRIALTGGGRLSVIPEGTQVRLEAYCPNDGRGLYKVWLTGEAGRFLLGTPVPEGNGLRLQRRVSRSSLAQAGCWPITGGECVLAFSFDQSQPRLEWMPEAHPEELMKDDVLRRVLRGSRLLLRRQENGFCLAGPFDSARAFPIPALFCLSEVGQVQGRPHVFFYFDRNGMPVPGHNVGHFGDNRDGSEQP